MDDLLKPIKTTKRVQNNISKFESLSLNERNPNRQPDNKPKPSIFRIDAIIQEEPALRPSNRINLIENESNGQLNAPAPKRHKRHDSTAFLQRSYLESPTLTSLSDDAAVILKSQPCQEDLKAVLEYLQYGIDGRHDFNVCFTSPRSAKIINILVTVTIPDIWQNLRKDILSKEEVQSRKTLISCLTNTAGLAALVAQIRQLAQPQANDHNNTILIDLIDVLARILKGSKVVSTLLELLNKLYTNEVQKRLYWQEVCTLLGGGRVLSTVAQALGTNKDLDNVSHLTWLGNGAEYSKWLAKNIITTALNLSPTDEKQWISLTNLLKRALSLGHKESLISGIYTSLLLGNRAYWTPLHRLLQGLAPHEQKVVFDTILYDISKKYLHETSLFDVSNNLDTKKAVSGVAGLLAQLVKHNNVLEEYLEEWIVVANASYATVGLATRRALIAVLSQSEDKLERVLDKAMTSFADKLQIQHDPILRQEACAQTVLLAVGCIKRINPSILSYPSISSLVMRSVSNRLAASVSRSRFLGMLIGVAVSRIVDAPDKVLDFDVEEMNNQETKDWLSLVDCYDSIGDVSNLQNISRSESTPKHRLNPPNHPSNSRVKPAPSQTSKIISIEEVFDVSEDEDDIIPYQKPDSDPEDSDDDPTLIDRNKPSTPVYIIDLVKGLSKTDQPATIEMALKAAPSLIRRKAGFGSEVPDNIHDLATALVNLQEGLGDPKMRQLRLDSLIACVVAKPDIIGPSLARLFFEGDFSISQRAALLTAIGLGVREVAGFRNDVTSVNSSDDFPSKRLPPHLEPTKSKQITTSPQDPIAILTTTVAQDTIRPMALAAADKVTGPAVLKIRTFSSRMNVEKQKKEKAQARTKIIPKHLHSLLTKSFFLPLCCRLSLLLSYAGGGNVNTTILDPSLVRMQLQTLTLILHTLGPSASLHLPTLTQEILILLTSLHTVTNISTDPIVLPAMLHLFLALIDLTIEAGISAQERLISQQGKQVVELMSWMNGLNDTLSIPEAVGEDGGMPWTILAAGIQVKWFEMSQRFQARMLGLTSDEMDGFQW